MTGPEQAPTRTAILALREERVVVGEAYDFLDEKRLLLAAKLLDQLTAYQRQITELVHNVHSARRSLMAAVERHGLQGLSVYPATPLDGFRLETTERNFMGVTVTETEGQLPEPQEGLALGVCNPSQEAQACQEIFRQIVDNSAILAGITGNLYRLSREYRLTERRARALENVILPELDRSLGEMSNQLEEMELEDAVRVRLPAQPSW